MEILNQFGVQPVLLAAQVVNFFILLFILKKFLYSPLLKVLETRKRKIEDSLRNAEEIELKLTETNEKIDKMMVKVSSEIQKMTEEAKKSASQIIDEARLEALNQAQEIMEKNQEAVKLEKEKMISEVKSHVVDLVIEVFKKITGKVISKEDQKKLIEREIRNLA